MSIGAPYAEVLKKKGRKINQNWKENRGALLKLVFLGLVRIPTWRATTGPHLNVSLSFVGFSPPKSVLFLFIFERRSLATASISVNSPSILRLSISPSFLSHALRWWWKSEDRRKFFTGISFKRNQGSMKGSKSYKRRDKYENPFLYRKITCKINFEDYDLVNLLHVVNLEKITC